MLGLGMGEMLIVAVVVLLVVGPDNLPQFARSAGKFYGQLRRTADDLRRSLVLEADRQDAEDRYQKLQERRRQAEEQRKKAQEANPGVTPQEEFAPGAPPEGHASPADGADGTDEGDQDLQALLADPHGPYATGTDIEDFAERFKAQSLSPSAGATASTSAPAPRDAHGLEGLPDGVTPEEWAELPPHIRDMLKARSQESA